MGRTTAVVMALVALSIAACPGGPGEQTLPDGSVGCTGFGCTDGGSSSDGGAPLVTVPEARRRADGGEHVRVVGLVHSVWTRQPSPLGAGDLRAEVWVTDPGDPTRGIWVEKTYTDLSTDPLHVGDVLLIDGYLGRVPAAVDVTGYRVVMKNQTGFVTTNPKPLQLQRLDAGIATGHLTVDAGEFGDAEGGLEAADPQWVGARVHLRGPVEITDPTPAALTRYRLGEVIGYAGFEVSGGVLVSDLQTASLDGGFGEPGRCDWRRVAEAGERVVFANGIFGVWDSYTHAPCLDGGTLEDGGVQCYPLSTARGFIPGTDAGFTHILYPQDCAHDLDGGVAK